jgi:arsenate reductase (thioredoxin)
MYLVVFACVHNAGRSQMAAALFSRDVRPGAARAISAGTNPGAAVYPEVIQVMAELGLDLSSAAPQRLTPELAAGARWLITMGCGDQCPVVLGVARDDWPLPDPKGRPVAEVRAIREDIERRVGAFLAAQGWAR